MTKYNVDSMYDLYHNNFRISGHTSITNFLKTNKSNILNIITNYRNSIDDEFDLLSILMSTVYDLFDRFPEKDACRMLLKSMKNKAIDSTRRARRAIGCTSDHGIKDSDITSEQSKYLRTSRSSRLTQEEHLDNLRGCLEFDSSLSPEDVAIIKFQLNNFAK